MKNLLGDKPPGVIVGRIKAGGTFPDDLEPTPGSPFWFAFHHCLGCTSFDQCGAIQRCIAKITPTEIVDMAGKKPTNTAQATIEDREASHGDYTKQAATAQALKDDLKSRGWNLSDPQKEALEMICVKLSRIVNGDPNNPDHWTDIAGYATLVHNLLTKGHHL